MDVLKSAEASPAKRGARIEVAGDGARLLSSAGFTLRYFRPAAPLRDWVSSYYLFEAPGPLFRDTLRAELPQVRFLCRGRAHFRFGSAAPVPVPAAALCGPTAVALGFEASGPLAILGAGLLPAGWAALVGEGADRFANSVADLDAVVGRVAAATLERLQDALTAREMVAAVDAFFLLLSSRAKPPPLWFTRAADAWLADSIDPDVNDLVRATGMSARQIERLALRVYGASPKLLARKYRTLQAAVRLGLHPEAGWEAAAAGAFYDQSHFIREFKTFVGMTPRMFADPSSPWLTRLTIAKRQAMPGMPRLNAVS